jgi:hypothetical protein
MDNWVALYHLGSVSHEDRLRDAERHQRLIGSNRFEKLPMILRALLVLMS